MRFIVSVYEIVSQSAHPNAGDTMTIASVHGIGNLCSQFGVANVPSFCSFARV